MQIHIGITDSGNENSTATERTVTILAIGVKEGNRLIVGGEEIEL